MVGRWLKTHWLCPVLVRLDVKQSREGGGARASELASDHEQCGHLARKFGANVRSGGATSSGGAKEMSQRAATSTSTN